jgi:twitching motility protein PilT
VAEKTVLVVNSDEVFFASVKDALATHGGYEATNVISSARAVGLAQATLPSAVIVDGDMVGVDSYELTQQIKEVPELADTPVLILTAAPTEASALKARQAGAAAHMPFSAGLPALVDKVVALTGGNGDGPPAAAAPAGFGTAPAAVYEATEPIAAAAGYGVPEPVQPGTAYTVPQPAPQMAPMEPVSPAAVHEPMPVPPAPAPATHSASADRDTPNIDDLLMTMINRGGSDLHLTVGSPPGVRMRGEIVPLEDIPALTPKDTQAMILNLLSEEQRKRFETELELDFAYSVPGISRFRANVFQQRNSMGAVFRVIPLKIPTMEDLGLPKVCKYLAERPRGLVLVTGPTGSGKSTTLAAMVDHINSTRPVHIITLEDPIEFMHKNKKAYVNQREVGEDTHSFAAALKRVLRQDPDVILVGEMRDLETIAAAITAAETGHLVLATLHTTGGPATVDRIIDVFPPHQQQQVRMQLSGTLEGVLSQVLLRSTDGRSRVLAMEIMLGVPAIGNLIREGKTHQMATIIQGGASLGMQTLDQHLKILLQAGRVTYEEAMGKAQNPRELAQLIGRKL